MEIDGFAPRRMGCEAHVRDPEVQVVKIWPLDRANVEAYGFCVCSPHHLPVVEPHRWGLREDGYLIAGIGGTHVRLHRLVYEAEHGPIPAGMEVDHMNRDRRDNRIENLTLATKREQRQNTNRRPAGEEHLRGVSARQHGYPGYSVRVESSWPTKAQAAFVAAIMRAVGLPSSPEGRAAFAAGITPASIAAKLPMLVDFYKDGFPDLSTPLADADDTAPDEAPVDDGPIHDHRSSKEIYEMPTDDPSSTWKSAEGCSVPGCDRPHAAKGLCSKHWARQHEGRLLDPLPAPVRLCSVLDCGKKHLAGGLCEMHYRRKQRGIPLDAPFNIRPNRVEIEGNDATLYLTSRSGQEIGSVRFDADLVDKVGQFRWHSGGLAGGARTNIQGEVLGCRLHRYILAGCPDNLLDVPDRETMTGFLTDDRGDHRRSNLGVRALTLRAPVLPAGPPEEALAGHSTRGIGWGEGKRAHDLPPNVYVRPGRPGRPPAYVADVSINGVRRAGPRRKTAELAAADLPYLRAGQTPPDPDSAP